MLLIVQAGDVAVNPGPNPPHKIKEYPSTAVSEITANIIARERPKGKGGSDRIRGGEQESGSSLKTNDEQFVCQCGKIYGRSSSLVRHQINCKAMASSPERLLKRRQSPSPLKTPRSAGFKILKPCTAKVTVYREDKRNERLIKSSTSLYARYQLAESLGICVKGLIPILFHVRTRSSCDISWLENLAVINGRAENRVDGTKNRIDGTNFLADILKSFQIITSIV